MRVGLNNNYNGWRLTYSPREAGWPLLFYGPTILWVFPQLIYLGWASRRILGHDLVC